jgi:hypothetical protein
MKETQKSYMAGFVDGEGTIYVDYRRTKKNFPSLHYQLSVFSTNLPILELLHQEWGGNLRKYAKSRSIKHKQIYSIYWGSDKCLPVIKAIYPYLRIKKRHAEIIMELSKLKCERSHGRGRYVPESTRLAREPLANELKVLNHRGVL